MLSEREIERDLADDADEFNWNFYGFPCAQEGGVLTLSNLLAKAISPIANATTDPKTWGYKDIAHLPELEQGEWQNACLRELKV